MIERLVGFARDLPTCTAILILIKMQPGEIYPGSARRWIALACLCLVLIFVGLETTHAPPSGDLARGSSPCAICIAVHANAPALTAHSLPVLFTVERLTVLFR